MSLPDTKNILSILEEIEEHNETIILSKAAELKKIWLREGGRIIERVKLSPGLK